MTGFPDGTVTFLFTDVVGSSQLWDQHHDDMRAAMVNHDQVSKATVGAHSGVIVKHTGDGVFAAFASALDAVDAGLALQEAMTAHGEVRLALRMGVHTGEADQRDNDYFGPSVSRAARVMNTADAGSISVSAATHELIQDRLPNGWQLSESGEVTLRGFDRAERVSRLVRDGQETSPPAGGTAHERRRAAWIAVLPFENLSNDLEQDYFADGVSEDLITRLGAFRSLSVIARTTSFNYRDSGESLPRIATALGVGFVLTGSVRRSADRVRVSVQLIEAESQRQLWSSRYDTEIDDVFDAQDDITDSIVAAIDPAIRATAIQRSASLQPSSLDAWDHVQRGLAAYYQSKPDANVQAREHFQSAIDIDPGYALAHAALSRAHVFDGWLLWVSDPARSLEIALNTAKVSVELDPGDAEAHLALAVALFGLGRLDASALSAERAVALNPSLPGGHIFAGVSRVHGTDPAAGIEMITHGIDLNPQDALLNWWLGVRAIGHFILGDNEMAIADARAAIAVRYGYLMGRVMLCAALADSGDLDGAAREMTTLLSIHPDFRSPMLDQYVFRDEDRARLLQRLIDAGLPA